MFKDEKFKVKYTVDKRGRPINDTSAENLRKYYELDTDDSSSESQSESDVSDETKVKVKDDQNEQPGRFVRLPNHDDDNSVEKEQDNVKNDKLVRGKIDKKIKNRLLDLEIDYARGEGFLQTDSSSDEESSQSEVESDLEHEWGTLDADAESTEESTKRFAVCNMDWDNINAKDIMVLLSSFLPAGGVIHRISVYPSEYGLKRMQEEEVRGPIELTENKYVRSLSDDDENEEGSSYHMEKLRRYQLNRLKYYYAVVECDSVNTADKLYNECDGMEYESSATKLDLRFIPDDVTFDQEPREVCTKLPDLTKYHPRLFTTTALQQAKVELTWDATNPNRTDTIKKAFDGNIDDLNLDEYLASSTDEESDEKETSDQEEENSEDPIEKYKKLLQDVQEKEEKKKNKDMEMEITWGLGLKEKADELVKKKLKDGDKHLTPFEKIIEKRKEKKRLKKLERQKKRAQETSDLSNEEDSSDEIPSDIDINDPYFAEEFNKPEFKKSNNKTKKKNEKEIKLDEEEEKRKAELELLLDDELDSKAHFSLKKIQEAENIDKRSKRKKKLKQKMIEQKQSEADFEINLNDERFSAVYNSHLYNIDPTDPNYKKTQNMEKLIQEKLRRRPKETSSEEHVPTKKTKEDAELSLLIKNIKRKTNKTVF
ncbi:ESF1 homolog [Eumeta japonica]|uniref:ESF1 homolog n=1 Tax=Eumeta variegata TaxID=151549 RepID=A0A4C1W878_EUMVA|nr:ESF1 homolog [Eumeta japonica]